MALLATAPASAEELVRLPTRPGVTQAFWLMLPEGPPKAAVILFAGSEGVLNSANNAEIHNNNFLLRSRAKFAARGLLVASVDAPSDRAAGMAQEFRASAEHAQDIAAVIANLRARAAVPVWLVGTSQGTVSAASVAARLKSGGADGLVLTSTIVASSRRSWPVASLVDLAAVTLPTIIVHNRDDACVVCPFAAAQALPPLFTHARNVQFIAVSGGSTPQSDPCEALSRHGYIGIEDEVIDDIVKAMAVN
jgi:pimeloyl-ACP methyl ester carboxylesterase